MGPFPIRTAPVRLTGAVLILLLAVVSSGCGASSSTGVDSMLRAEVSQLCGTASHQATELRAAQEKAIMARNVRRLGQVVDRSATIVKRLATSIARLLPPAGDRAVHFYAATLALEGVNLHRLALAIGRRQEDRLPALAQSVGVLGQAARTEAIAAHLTGCGQAVRSS
jgi:hypothetical protein